jgi:hypothetical protein
MWQAALLRATDEPGRSCEVRVRQSSRLGLEVRDGGARLEIRGHIFRAVLITKLGGARGAAALDASLCTFAREEFALSESHANFASFTVHLTFGYCAWC